MDIPDWKDLYRHMLDVIPTPVFLMNSALDVVEHNAAASEILIAPARTESSRQTGHVLRCLNAVHRTEGCGRTPFCSDCGLRKALNSAVRGERHVRSRTTLRLLRDGREQNRVFRVNVAPFHRGTDLRWLLFLEDRTEQAELESLFPICSSCKEPRSDAVLRERAENYLARHWDGDPAACLCPSCKSRL